MVGRLTLARLALCGGLILLIVGTFLPWLRSGRSTRNSYATDGAVRRLLEVSGPVDVALRAWPFVSLLCAVAVAAVIVGRRVLGPVLGVAAAAVAGAVAAVALASGGHGLLKPALSGPIVTLIGAAITMIAAFACSPAFGRRPGRDLP